MELETIGTAWNRQSGAEPRLATFGFRLEELVENAPATLGGLQGAVGFLLMACANVASPCGARRHAAQRVAVRMAWAPGDGGLCRSCF
jgi:hypothetical protein